MGYLLIRNGRVIDRGKSVQKDLLIRDEQVISDDFSGTLPGKNGEISAAGAPSADALTVIDAEGCYVAPGFVEIHAHGGGGADVMDATADALETVCATHLRGGTTSLVVTTLSAPFESIRKVVECCGTYADRCPNFAGIHLEGPYLSETRKGAHKSEYLHTPTAEETEYILSKKHLIRRITAAPELPGMFEFAEKMAAEGIGMACGHSDATSEEALEGFRRGFSHVTHLYNALSTWRKIDQVLKAGVVEAAYLDDRASVEIIGDGKHVAADCGRLAFKIKGPEKMALVSDALRPAGLKVKESYIGEICPANRVIIEDGVAKLPDRSAFAGSIATGEMLLQQGVRYFGFSVEDTVRMMTETPAKILGRSDIGRLVKGARADAVIFDDALRLKQVICRGKTV